MTELHQHVHRRLPVRLPAVQGGLVPGLGVTATLDQVEVSLGGASVPVSLLACAIDGSLPANVVRVAAAHSATLALGEMFGAISVEKA